VRCADQYVVWVAVGLFVRVRVEIMGPQKCRIVGKSQSVLIVIDPIIFTRTRIWLLWQVANSAGVKADKLEAVVRVGAREMSATAAAFGAAVSTAAMNHM
jgi:hypothetical protein